MARNLSRLLRRAIELLALLALLPSAPRSLAYSVLTHEAIIDAAWDNSIQKLLRSRFPGATPDQLREAHSYAYGGCIIQDMGYYPFGNHLFSNLVHYVRTGDFIQALIEESQDLNEYAFALGALAHYASDNEGHAHAVNRSVPMLYPRLRRKFGDDVTYAQDPKAHVLTEFGFDVVQIAGGAYAPDAYHNFIGFNVSKPVLERAFKRTYGISFKDLFLSEDLALGTYRRSASIIIPQMTKVAWQKKNDEIQKAMPGITRRKFIYRMPRKSYEKDFGNSYQKPGFTAKVLAFLFIIIPKVGPFKSFAFKAPTPQTERLFAESVKSTVEQYRGLLEEARAGKLKLENKDFDTGKATRQGEYSLADTTYAELLDKLDHNQFHEVTPELRENILAFYRDMRAPVGSGKQLARAEKTWKELEKLKVATTTAALAPKTEQGGR